MTMIAPDDPNSLGPDLDPPVDPFPPGPRGDLMRQIDATQRGIENALAVSEQYASLAADGQARLRQLQAQLAALTD